MLVCLSCAVPLDKNDLMPIDCLCSSCLKETFGENAVEVTQEMNRQAEEARNAPESLYWSGLVDRVYSASEDATENGFDALPSWERHYFLLNCLSGEIFNGGFDQFFTNTSGARYGETINALEAEGATVTLGQLRQAKVILLGEADVPVDQVARFHAMPTAWYETDRQVYDAAHSQLNVLDRAFWDGPDEIGPILSRIAKDHRLY